MPACFSSFPYFSIGGIQAFCAPAFRAGSNSGQPPRFLCASGFPCRFTIRLPLCRSPSTPGLPTKNQAQQPARCRAALCLMLHAILLHAFFALRCFMRCVLLITQTPHGEPPCLPVQSAAARSWRVYSCWGWSKISSTVPCSTMRPCFITSTRSHSWYTTFRSWLMNR